MTKRLPAIGLLAALLFLTVGVSAAGGTAPSASGTVVLLLAPHLRWPDVVSGYMPETARMAEDAAVGNMNVRSLLPDPGHPSAEAGALMISAGTWASHEPSAAAPVQADGVPAIRYPGLAVQRRANADEDADIRLGTLGQAIEDAGGITAAIGNGDGGGIETRPAALVGMNARGEVDYGDISSRMVTATASQDGALGLRSDPDAIMAVLDDVLERTTTSPSLIVIDPGDLERAHRAAAGEPEDLRRLDRLGALQALDELVSRLRSRLPGDVTLIIASPVAPEVQGTPPGFGPLIVGRSGWSGMLSSASTHRVGLVTSADLTAAILDMLAIEPPVQVAGSPFHARDTGTGEMRLLTLERVDAFMRSVDGIRGTIVNCFIIVVTIVIAACLALAAMPRLPRAAAQLGQLALLAVAAVPAASLLMFVPLALPQTPGLVLGMFLGTTAIVLVLDVATHHSGAKPRSLSLLALLAALVILADQWFGGPLSLDALFSYSPLVGARYYGMGNEAAALLVGGALTGFALLFDTYTAHRRWVPAVRRWGLPVVGALCVFTAAAPFLGANVGVTIWGVFAFALGWWGMTGRKVGWRVVAAVLLVIVVLVVAFAAMDLLSGGERTHLGRSLSTAVRGGPGQLLTIVSRKAATNVRVLLSTSWSLLFLALAAALAYVRWRPRGTFRDMLMERPNFASALSAVIVSGVIAYFTEDSGIVVPALLLLFPTIAVVYLMLWRRISVGPAS